MNQHSGIKPVITKAALALQNIQNEFKAIYFEEAKKQEIDVAHVKKSKESTLKNIVENGNDFDIKKARHEILSFAMNNQRIEKNKKRMLINQLVNLGAKPPKKECKNYKELLDEKRRLKQIREERKRFHQLGKNQTGSASVKCRSKTKLEKQQRKRHPVAAIDQHYGVVKIKKKK